MSGPITGVHIMFISHEGVGFSYCDHLDNLCIVRRFISVKSGLIVIEEGHIHGVRVGINPGGIHLRVFSIS